MTQPAVEPAIAPSDGEALRAIANEVMDVHDTTYAPVAGIAVRFRGQLRMASDQAYHIIAQGFRGLGYTPLLHHEDDGAAAILAADEVPDTSSRLWVALTLFAVTFLSVLYVGALNEVGDFVPALFEIARGLPFALSLMAILLSHEMGHFVAGKLLGMPMSFPFFIPLPLPPLGTMGAVIQMKAPPINRRSMLLVGAAGPIAGLVVALPLLLLGFSMSRVTPLDLSQPVLMEGNSILYLLLKLLWFGKLLPGGGEDVMIHAVAFAGWVGLFITALNLIPVGQLDGGHIVNALFGDRVAIIRWPIIVALVVLGFWPGGWMGWLLWAGLVLIFGGIRAQPLDDITQLKPWHWALGLVMLLILVLIFVPAPLTIWGEVPPLV
ncbi:MAG: site-2 protease family protein [Chloroflexi bacterium]|nr:site-2 protease family protein [Chloroflexota bacterium]